MTYRSVPYEDPCSTPDMVSDCAEVGRTLHMTALPASGRGVAAPAPTGSATAAPCGAVVVPEHLARMAAGLQLHLD